MARRAGLTVTSFSYSKRLRGAGGGPGLSQARASGRDAGAGSRRLAGHRTFASLADAKRARVAGLARCVLRPTPRRTALDASVKRVLIGNVPDRGGRTEEARGAGNMPAFTARVAGVEAGGEGAGPRGDEGAEEGVEDGAGEAAAVSPAALYRRR